MEVPLVGRVEGLDPGVSWPGGGPSAVATAGAQWVPTAARTDWRSELVVAITAVGS